MKSEKNNKIRNKIYIGPLKIHVAKIKDVNRSSAVPEIPKTHLIPKPLFIRSTIQNLRFHSLTSTLNSHNPCFFFFLCLYLFSFELRPLPPSSPLWPLLKTKLANPIHGFESGHLFPRPQNHWYIHKPSFFLFLCKSNYIVILQVL